MRVRTTRRNPQPRDQTGVGLHLQILRHLADGGFHTGAALAREFSRSRTAIWKAVGRLRASGLEIASAPRRGYRLTEPLELLDAAVLQAAMESEPHVPAHRPPEIFYSIASTNQLLLDGGELHGRIVLAETQTAGRGRRGNSWQSPPGAGLYLSTGWRFDSPPAAWMILSLLSGVAVIRALRRAGIGGVGLKWPNDLMYEGCKLGGILVESRGQLAGPVDAVIGVGINLSLPRRGIPGIQQPVTDLRSVARRSVRRNGLAAAVIVELLRMLERCVAGIGQEDLAEWRRHDVGRGKDARLLLAGRELRGRIVDIDDNGMLVMMVNGEAQHFGSGDLSLRLDP